MPMFLVSKVFEKRILAVISNAFSEMYIYFSMHHDCISTDGQARKEEPSHNKIIWNGTAFFTVNCVLVFLDVA